MAGHQLGGTIIVGAGQAGLAAAFQLRARGIGCRILEAAESPGQGWRDRWDSLRLFTPAQYCSLPGMEFPAPGGSFPTRDQVAAYLSAYAEALPVTTGVSVTGIHRDGAGFTVDTSAGTLTASQVVIATGATSTPFIPDMASKLSPAIHQLHSSGYRNAPALPDGGVLVVGAATSGIEIAVELAADRRVWLAGRVPFHIPDAVINHAGGAYWHFIHRVLTRSTPLGKKIARDFTAQGGPLISISIADAQNAGVACLSRLAEVADDGHPVFANHPPLDVATIIWATGYQPRFDWVDDVPVDGRGWPVTNRGEVETLPGLYFVGMPFQYGLTSTLLGGVGRDAAHVADRIALRQKRGAGSAREVRRA
ncbi:flavin-containing monooxygenase [Specibacter sp. AOP5-B1-6]|uniref:flavin-containing monooxygenase n=1 Tax=Specibacter sp. AOP5-B1-6 TaxID=3457653 RepID=UPI003FB6C618